MTTLIDKKFFHNDDNTNNFLKKKFCFDSNRNFNDIIENDNLDENNNSEKRLKYIFPSIENIHLNNILNSNNFNIDKSIELLKHLCLNSNNNNKSKIKKRNYKHVNNYFVQNSNENNLNINNNTNNNIINNNKENIIQQNKINLIKILMLLIKIYS